MTKWWHEPRTQAELEQYRTPDSAADLDGPAKLNQAVDDIADLLKQWSTGARSTPTPNQRSAFERFVALCALVFLAGESLPPAVAEIAPDGTTPTMSATEVKQMTDEAVEKLKQSSRTDISRAVFEVLRTMNLEPKSEPLVFQISLNRRATAAIDRSVPTVKADAARRLFGVDCSKINWAIIDSGIDSTHPAFDRKQFKGTYDFSNYRRIVSLGNNKESVRKKNLERIQEAFGDNIPDDALGKLAEIAEGAVKGLPVRWDLVKEFVELKDPPQPVSEHGTHVAGIIGAARREGRRRVRRRDVPRHRPLRLPHPERRPHRHRVRGDRGPPVHSVHQRTGRLPADQRRQPEPVHST